MSETAMTVITVMTAVAWRHHCMRRVVVCGQFSQAPHTGQSGPHDSHGSMSFRLAVWPSALVSLASSSEDAAKFRSLVFIRLQRAVLIRQF